jgi:hypothetical protein
LASALKPGHVVILDNLVGAHKGERVREQIGAGGSELIFLSRLLSGFQADRRRSLQDQSAAERGRKTHPRGFG